MTKTFFIDEVSEVDGVRYQGNFTTKKLTIGDMLRMGTEMAQMTGGLSYNPLTGRGLPYGQSVMAEMIAHCTVSLVQRPEWFNEPTKLTDIAILEAVYKEVDAFEASFRRPTTSNDEQEGAGDGPKSGLATSDDQSHRSAQPAERLSSHTAPMVGKEVPLVTQIG
tara:strand:- start:199 stop:693 length:495 start_codon:yes stop_codon:yes gene_type:complete